MKVTEESEKAGLKLNIQKNEDNGIWSHRFMAKNGDTMETVTDFIFLGPKSLQMVTAALKLKRCLLFGRNAMTNLDSILKSRDINLLTKIHYS